jgi:hypoxanthine phosphoribosyltransferase/nucleoside 2-deoxyribosyltransferase
MNLTWLDIERLVERLHQRITTDGFKPDYIVGIASGGLVPLYALAKRLGIGNVLTVTVRSYAGREQGRVEILYSPHIDARGKSVLVVDEIADSGMTLTEVSMHIREVWRAREVRSAVLCTNEHNCAHLPTYSALNVEEWVDFPWEMYEHRGKDSPGVTETIRPRIYVASDCGFSGDKRPWYNNTLVPMLRKLGFEVLDPWEMAPKDMLERILRLPPSLCQVYEWKQFNDIVGKTNADAIVSSHLVLALLNGPDVDSGASSEVGFASAHGIPVIGYRDDMRLSGDNSGCIVNLQVEYFIKKNDGRIYRTMDDLKRALDTFKQQWI